MKEKMKEMVQNTCEKLVQMKTTISMVMAACSAWFLNGISVLAADGEADPFSFMNGKDNGMFNSLKTTVEQSGSSATGLLVALGAVTLVIALMLVGLFIMVSKNPNKRDENKTWVMGIVLGALLVFGAGSFGTILYNMGKSM